MEDKNSIREKMMQWRSELTITDKQVMNESICAQLIHVIKSIKPKVIHSYLPMGDEVDVRPVIQYALDEDIRVVTSQSLAKGRLKNWILYNLSDLKDGIFGTKYPANSQVYVGEYDLIIVPGLAFTKEGDRIGYGAGYYDVFLADKPEAHKVGVAYPFQMLENLPREDHDVQLNQIIFA